MSARRSVQSSRVVANRSVAAGRSACWELATRRHALPCDVIRTLAAQAWAAWCRRARSGTHHHRNTTARGKYQYLSVVNLMCVFMCVTTRPSVGDKEEQGSSKATKGGREEVRRWRSTRGEGELPPPPGGRMHPRCSQCGSRHVRLLQLARSPLSPSLQHHLPWMVLCSAGLLFFRCSHSTAQTHTTMHYLQARTRAMSNIKQQTNAKVTCPFPILFFFPLSRLPTTTTTTATDAAAAVAT
ncbi:uncharacterized protein J3D65DRAFT_174288 [Phyllosticta citribraziliensis]|uniref:Uncharacterized protein n=1 Tax=Phyllosticta citribraziliensis TaxID=989973 RepID=A0ABR1L335_9PEZI